MIDRLNKALPLLLITNLVLMWELIVRWSDIPHYILPAPSGVLSTIFTQADILFQEASYTALEAALGLVVGISAAVFLGVFASRFSLVEKTVMPIVEDTLSADLIEDEPITVLNIATGSNIVNRSIEIPDSVFSLDIERIYFHTNIRNWNDSKTIYHKWYQEGELKSLIRIEIGRSFNWRAWSYISVFPDRVGDWKVIVEDTLGVRYDSLSFKIIKEPID